MNNPLKNKGFRELVIKGAIFVALVVLAQKLVNWFLVDSPIFQNFLDIPAAFQIGKGVISLSITNALIFGVVVFVMLTHKSIFEIKTFKTKGSQTWFFLLAVLFFVLHYLFKFLINRNLDFFSQAPLLWGIVKVLIQILFAGSVFLGVFGLDFTKHMLKTYKNQILTTIIVTVAFFILMLLVQNLWTYFSSAISEMLYRVFSIFFENVTYKPFVASFTMQEGGGPLLGINGFRAIVGKPCSGIDSFLLFTSLYVLIFILDYRKLDRSKAAFAYLIGIIGMFLVNTVRILLLFIIGAYVDRDFAIGLFHTNAGWLLFIVYFFVFWFIASKYIYLKKDKPSSDRKRK